MKKVIIAIMLLSSLLVQGQQTYRDSLKKALVTAEDDVTKFACLNNLFYQYI